jgi:hypothetical protein
MGYMDIPNLQMESTVQNLVTRDKLEAVIEREKALGTIMELPAIPKICKAMYATLVEEDAFDMKDVVARKAIGKVTAVMFKSWLNDRLLTVPCDNVTENESNAG